MFFSPDETVEEKIQLKHESIRGMLIKKYIGQVATKNKAFSLALL